MKIAPVKEEQLYDKPSIWLYHDVIRDKDINMMKSLAAPRLKRALIRNGDGLPATADYRVSKSAWLLDSEHPNLNYLSKFLSAITNLSMSSAEEWQVISNFNFFWLF